MGIFWAIFGQIFLRETTPLLIENMLFKRKFVVGEWFGRYLLPVFEQGRGIMIQFRLQVERERPSGFYRGGFVRRRRTRPKRCHATHFLR